jgi:hypothetical protein
VTTHDGYPVVLYVKPCLAGLMPIGKLKEGERSTMVRSLQRMDDKDKEATALRLFSYDPI